MYIFVYKQDFFQIIIKNKGLLKKCLFVIKIQNLEKYFLKMLSECDLACSRHYFKGEFLTTAA